MITRFVNSVGVNDNLYFDFIQDIRKKFPNCWRLEIIEFHSFPDGKRMATFKINRNRYIEYYE